MAVHEAWVIKDPEPIKIDFEKIFKVELRLLCATTLKTVEELYKNLENEKVFGA